MRSFMCVAALGLIAGCTARPIRLVTDGGSASLDALLQARPLAANANIRADEIARTTGATVHLVQVRGGESPHRHAAHDLTVIVLRGEGVLTIGGVPRPMAAGDVAVVPRGALHYFVRSGRGPAVAAVVFAPPLNGPDSVPEPLAVDSAPDAR